MNKIHRIEEEIEQNLREHGFSQVRRVVVEEGIDTTGDDAYYIWVLLDDKVPDKRLSWHAIRPLVEHVKAYMHATHEAFWPYVRVRRLREWDEMIEEMDDVFEPEPARS